MAPTTRGWIVTLAGLGINLALGGLYSWSVVAQALTVPASEGGLHLWTAQQANWPYAVAVGVFAVTMVFAGRLQDALGPRPVATMGGVFVGVGLLTASQSPARMTSPTAFPSAMVLGFGVLTGAGIGLAYAAATPAAVKWFATQRKGLVTGIVVCGFALASLYAPPLTSVLISRLGVGGTLMALGGLFFVVIVGFAQLLADPPAGYVPPHSYDKPVGSASPQAPEREYEWRCMLKTRSFAILWLTYACAAFAGLMIISIVARIMPLQMPGAATETGVVVVAALALGNAIGRPASGALSDRIGRRYTMLGVFLGQALVVGVLGFATSWPLLAAAAFLIGLNYGANLALFPATTFDFFGTRNGGVNYGLVFTAWGVGGVFGSQLAAFILDASHSATSPSGSYAMAYAIASAMCLAAAGLTFLARPPKSVPVVRQRASDVAVHVKTPA